MYIARLLLLLGDRTFLLEVCGESIITRQEILDGIPDSHAALLLPETETRLEPDVEGHNK